MVIECQRDPKYNKRCRHYILSKSLILENPWTFCAIRYFTVTINYQYFIHFILSPHILSFSRVKILQVKSIMVWVVHLNLSKLWMCIKMYNCVLRCCLDMLITDFLLFKVLILNVKFLIRLLIKKIRIFILSLTKIGLESDEVKNEREVKW